MKQGFSFLISNSVANDPLSAVWGPRYLVAVRGGSIFSVDSSYLISLLFTMLSVVF
jgi:hypothetical protein